MCVGMLIQLYAGFLRERLKNAIVFYFHSQIIYGIVKGGGWEYIKLNVFLCLEEKQNKPPTFEFSLLCPLGLARTPGSLILGQWGLPWEN